MGELQLMLRQRKPIGRVFHYTSARGLLGIVSDREIWATDLHYLNDSEEFRYAFDLATKMATEKKKTVSEPRDIELFDVFIRVLSEISNVALALDALLVP